MIYESSVVSAKNFLKFTKRPIKQQLKTKISISMAKKDRRNTRFS
jgi:hypothetical protein